MSSQTTTAARRAAAVTACALLIFTGSLSAAADPQNEAPEEKKRYDNKDLERARPKTQQVPRSADVPAAAPPENTYTNSDLAKLPDPTELPPLPDGKKASKPGEATRTYTNQDLAPPGPGSQPDDTPPQDPSADSVASIVAIRRELDDAQSCVDELESRLRAVRNPFLPRPVLPPEEQQAWEGLDGAARVARVQGQLEEARRNLSLAVEKLSRLQPSSP